MTINELLYYGRYYKNEGDIEHWWFDSSTKQVIHYDCLVENLGYSSKREILNSNCFIPLFKTDIIELEYQFVLKFGSTKNKKFFQSILETLEIDFDTEFKIFIERKNLTKEWYEFERKKLYSDAVNWCHNNHLDIALKK